MKHLWRIGFCGMALLAGSSAPAVATTITFSGSGTGVDGAALAAQAIFDFTGDSLTVTLINIATSDNTNSNQDVSGNTLTGVFFDLIGSPTLTPMSATITGQIVQFELCNVASCEEETNVGGEFRYDTGGAFPGGAGQGIASSGYVGGPSGNFGGLNLDDPDSPDGINFGILSNDLSYLPNGGLANDPLIRNQVVFILTGVDGLSIDDISNVSFQYGTSLTEPNIPGDCTNCDQDVPEPATLMLLGCGLASLGLYRRRPRARG